jgi:hypothetical protein
MLSGQAGAPNQYRMLTPWLAEALRSLIPNRDLLGAYFLIRALATWLALWLLDRYLRTWFAASAAVGGALLLAALIPLTYYRVVQESDPVNLAVVVAGFLAVSRRPQAGESDRAWLWLIPLMLVGTLNRETTAMLPAVYFLGRWREEPTARVLTRAGLLAACWGAVYGGLLWHYGRKAYYTEPFMLGANLGSWLPTTFALLFFGALWVLPFLALRRHPPTLLRRTIWLLPPFVALQYLVGVVQEVRLFLPLAPIIIPLAWWWLFPEAVVEGALRGGPQVTKGRRPVSA